MAATTRWINGNPTVLIHEFVGKWSTPEFEKEILDATPEIESRTENVVVILDMLQYTMPTPDVNLFAMLRRFNNRRPANIQMTIIVIRGQFAHALLSAARKIVPKSNIMHLAASLDEALALIPKTQTPPTS
jgi:hypothetical protein